MALTKRLISFGNSYGIVIDKPIMELLGITPDTEIEMTTEHDGCLVLRPKHLDKRARLERADARTVKNHSETFRKLAK